jgi:hypothetical protein
MTIGPDVLRSVRWLAVVVCAGPGAAMAAQPVVDLDHRYPKGSIASAPIAERALADAAAVTRTIDSHYEAEHKRCAHVFLATQCQDAARRAHTLGRARAHRVEVEAHDLQRRLAAHQREASRDIDQTRQRREDAEQQQKERLAQNAAQKRVDGAEQRRQEAQRQQAQAPATRDRFEKRNAEHDQDEAKRASVQIRSGAENARRYQDKQTRAQTYATSRARERVENQKVRAERERERQQKTQTAQESTPLPVDPGK